MTSFYGLHKRQLVYDQSTPLCFPNTIEVIAEIQPSEAFGLGNRPSRTVHGPYCTMIVERYSGRVTFNSIPQILPARFTALFGNTTIQIGGNVPIGFTALFGTAKITVDGNMIKLKSIVESIDQIPAHIATLETT